MATPPLQLDRLFYTEVNIKGNPAPAPLQGEVEITTTVNLFHTKEQPKVWAVRLIIDSKPKEGQTSPYDIHLDAYGQFTVTDETLEEPKAAQMVHVTGASILYSAAREYLMMLTGRGPWGTFQLPTVSFVPGSQSPQTDTTARDTRRDNTTSHRKTKRSGGRAPLITSHSMIAISPKKVGLANPGDLAAGERLCDFDMICGKRSTR